MEYKTYLQLRTIVQRELDLEQEVFIQADELLEYFNQAINEAETAIHKLGVEDEYFLSSANIALVASQSDYALPVNIYANKIRDVIYTSGSTIYKIKRLRNKDKFLDKAMIDFYNSSQPFYRYLIKNNTAAAGVKMVLIPTSAETSSSNVTVWYIRNANKLAIDADLCDIPEFYQFVIAYVRWKVLDKEGHPALESAKMELEQQRALMTSTLENMVPDQESEIEQQIDIYEESS